MSADDTQVFRRDDALVMETLRKALLKLVESVFTDAARIALERLQDRNLDVFSAHLINQHTPIACKTFSCSGENHPIILC